MKTIFGLRGRRLAVATAAIFALVGGIAYAAIPDAGGVYHACMLKNIGTIRLIDPDKQHCSAALETEITFNQKGQNGAQGQPGVSPTVKQLAAGDPNCSAGGAAITDASGHVAYVCSGANGKDGADGRDGADGTPFSGTFTSPNHLYSISVTDTGVTIASPETTVAVSATGLRVDAHASSSVTVMSSNGLTLRSGTSATLQAGSSLSLRGDATATVSAGATLGLTGALMTLNGGSGCVPAARLGDQVLTNVPPEGGPSLGTIILGSPTVCIGS